MLGTVLVCSVIGFRGFGYSWIEACYLTVITIASVGYGERSQVSEAQQLFTIVVILFGISAGGYTLGGLVQMLFEGEIDRLLGEQKMEREIQEMSGHAIICGFGRMGQILSGDLMRHGREFVIVETDKARCSEAGLKKYRFLIGDATEEDVLLRAGVQKASSLISVLPIDAANVFITLTARNLNKTIQIIARAERPTTEKKLLQAGANRVVLPALIGAQHMVRMITRPSTADLMDLISQQGNLDLEVDEIDVSPNAKLVGVKVRETEAHKKYHLLVLAVKQASGKMVFHPEADYQFEAGDTVIMMGNTENIDRFRGDFHI